MSFLGWGRRRELETEILRLRRERAEAADNRMSEQLRLEAMLLESQATAHDLRASVERNTKELGAAAATIERLQRERDAAEAEAQRWKERAEYSQAMYHALIADQRGERETLVQHLVELKREGFQAPLPAGAPESANEPELPEVLVRACQMRSFDPGSAQQNRDYAMEQLALRGESAAPDIAREILAGAEGDTGDLSESELDRLVARETAPQTT